MSSPRVKSRARRLFAVIATSVAAVVLLAACVWWYSSPSRDAYLATASFWNIYVGLEDYDHSNGHLPQATAQDADSGQLISWRVEVYERSLMSRRTDLKYDRRNAWNDPGNLELQDWGASYFSYTSAHSGPDRPRYGYRTTYYKAISGADTAFAASPASLRQLPESLILLVRVEQSDNTKSGAPRPTRLARGTAQNGNRSSIEAAESSTRNPARRSTNKSISRRPLSAVAA